MTLGFGLRLRAHCTEGDCTTLGVTEVINLEVDVALLRNRPSWPAGRDVVLDSHRGQQDVVELHHPDVVPGDDDLSAQQFCPERAQRPRISTVQRDGTEAYRRHADTLGKDNQRSDRVGLGCRVRGPLRRSWRDAEPTLGRGVTGVGAAGSALAHRCCRVVDTSMSHPTSTTCRMKVFVSSLISGYEPYRNGAAEAAQMLGHTMLRAEDLGATPASPQQACLGLVRDSDVVVLLIGESYGAVQPSGLSATHEEYREARERKPVLVFVQEHVTRDEQQAEFLTEVQDGRRAMNRPVFCVRSGWVLGLALRVGADGGRSSRTRRVARGRVRCGGGGD